MASSPWAPDPSITPANNPWRNSPFYGSGGGGGNYYTPPSGGGSYSSGGKNLTPNGPTPAPAPAPTTATTSTTVTADSLAATSPINITPGSTTMAIANTNLGSVSPDDLLRLPQVNTNVTGRYPVQSELGQTTTQQLGTSEASASSTGVTSEEAQRSFLDRMDPQTRAAYEKLLTQQLAGGTPLQQAQQEALTSTMTRLGADADQYSMANAVNFAQGNVDSLTQNLLEQIIPQIQRGASGTGSVDNALAQIMSQNEAVKTGTAQQQAILDAVTKFGELSNQTAQTTGSLATAGDPIVNQLMQLIETGKGATEAGSTAGTTDTLTKEASMTNTLQELIKLMSQKTASTDVPTSPYYIDSRPQL